MAKRKHPTGFVATHFHPDTPDWTTAICVTSNDLTGKILETGWERANSQLQEHLKTCDLSQPDRARATETPGVTRRPIPKLSSLRSERG
jgi:hypothetical protein